MNYAFTPNAAVALILSPDALTGALVGAAVELAGSHATFPKADENPREALRRLRPAFVLIDCEHDVATRADFLGPGLMTGTRLFLFGTAKRVEECRSLLARFQLGLIVIPDDLKRLREILSQAPPSTPAPLLR